MLYNDSMKTKIVLIVTGALILGLLVAGVAVQYQKYKQEQAHAAALVTEERKKADNSHQVELNGWKARHDVLKAECEKGLVAYGLLPLSTRGRTTQPNCQAAP